MRRQGNKARQRGLKLLEVMILVSVIGLLIAVSANRIMLLRVDIERTAVRQALDTLNAGLAMQSAKHIVERQTEALRAMHHANPMRLLAPQGVELADYTGERFGPDPAVMEPGSWYFDQRDRMLVYRVRHPQGVDTELDGPPRLRFRVTLDERDGASLARLEAVEPYQWR